MTTLQTPQQPDNNPKKQHSALAALGVAGTGVILAQGFGDPNWQRLNTLQLPPLEPVAPETQVHKVVTPPNPQSLDADERAISDVLSGTREGRFSPEVGVVPNKQTGGIGGLIKTVLFPGGITFGSKVDPGTSEMRGTQPFKVATTTPTQAYTPEAFKRTLLSSIQELEKDGFVLRGVTVTGRASDEYMSAKGLGLNEINPENVALAKQRASTLVPQIEAVLKQTGLRNIKITTVAEETRLVPENQQQIMALAQSLRPAPNSIQELVTRYRKGELPPNHTATKALDEQLRTRAAEVRLDLEDRRHPERGVFQVPLGLLVSLAGIEGLRRTLRGREKEPRPADGSASMPEESQTTLPPPQALQEPIKPVSPEGGSSLQPSTIDIATPSQPTIEKKMRAIWSVLIRTSFSNNPEILRARLTGDSQQRLTTIDKDWIQELGTGEELWKSLVAMTATVSKAKVGVPVKDMVLAIVKDIASGVPAEDAIRNGSQRIAEELARRDQQEPKSAFALIHSQPDFTSVDPELAAKALFLVALGVEKNLFRNVSTSLVSTLAELNTVDGADRYCGRSLS